MTRTLHARVIVCVIASAAIVLSVAGLVLYSLIQRELNGGFDATLAQEARTLAALVEVIDGRPQSEIEEQAGNSNGLGEQAVAYQLWNSRGRLLESTPKLEQMSLPTHCHSISLDDPVFLDAPIGDDPDGRFVVLRFAPALEDFEELNDTQADDEDDQVLATLVVAHSKSRLNHTLSRIRHLLGSVWAGTLLIAIAVATPLVRVGLRPLRDLTTQIEELDSDALDGELDAAGAPQEIGRVIDCLNTLLQKLHGAFAREREFSANAAHELRTPLSGLRSTIDVVLSRPRDATEYARALEQCSTICRQAEGVTECLLWLARFDAGQVQVRKDVVVVDRLIERTNALFAERAKERDLEVVMHIDSSLAIETDPDLLALVVRNLIDNSISYADAGSRVTIIAERQKGVARISVENVTKGLTPELTNLAANRFWRADVARAETEHHAGLGLSLCHEVAKALNGQFEIQVTETVFLAELSLAQPG